ncbi:MAG: cytochrome c [Gemmatimonadota bacterium]
MRRAWLLPLALAIVGCSRDTGSSSTPGSVTPESVTAGEPVRHYGLGRAATAAEVTARDIDVGPDGEGLPAGSGSVQQGEALYKLKCAMCHGPSGAGMPPAFPAIIGRDPKAEGFAFARDPKLTRTIGNYWPNATTVFDYVRRAMPLLQPGSLTNDDVYALTAYLLAANDVVPRTTTLDAASLSQVKMPYAGKFVTDNRRGGREVK